MKTRWNIPNKTSCEIYLFVLIARNVPKKQLESWTKLKVPEEYFPAQTVLNWAARWSRHVAQIQAFPSYAMANWLHTEASQIIHSVWSSPAQIPGLCQKSEYMPQPCPLALTLLLKWGQQRLPALQWPQKDPAAKLDLDLVWERLNMPFRGISVFLLTEEWIFEFSLWRMACKLKLISLGSTQFFPYITKSGWNQNRKVSWVSWASVLFVVFSASQIPPFN